MTAHHEGAIAMANIAKQRAEHPEIRRLADQIVSAQKGERASDVWTRGRFASVGAETMLARVVHRHGPRVGPCRGIGPRAAVWRYGIRTRLMAWMIPLDVRTSAVTTFARFTNTLRPRTRIFTRLPLSVLIDERLTTRLAASRPEATW